jgi:hypothetical protein
MLGAGPIGRVLGIWSPVTRPLPLQPRTAALALAVALVLGGAPAVVQAQTPTTPTRTTETIVKRQKTGGPERTSTTTSITTGGTTEPTDKHEHEAIDWDSPDTWGDVATGGGFVVAALTLFVGFLVRSKDTHEERRRSQQEWAVTAAATAAAVRTELEEDGESASSITGVLHRRDRLRELMRQLDIADSSLITLADGGDERTRGPVMRGVGDLKVRTDAIATEYDWIGRLLERLDDKPGSQDEARLLRQARATVHRQESELIDATSRFRNALGAWLEASKAVPSGVRERVAGTQPDPKALGNQSSP